MKNIFRICLVSLLSINLDASWSVYNAYQTVAVNSVLNQRSLVNVATSTQDYTNGGITFTYPAGTFTAAPVVNLTIVLKNLAYSSATSLTAVVTANSSSSCTIRVNKATLISLVEAATNDVTIHITVTGPGV